MKFSLIQMLMALFLTAPGQGLKETGKVLSVDDPSQFMTECFNGQVTDVTDAEQRDRAMAFCACLLNGIEANSDNQELVEAFENKDEEPYKQQWLDFVYEQVRICRG